MRRSSRGPAARHLNRERAGGGQPTSSFALSRAPRFNCVTSMIDDWDGAYQQDAAPPWDIGRPQPAFVTLANEGRLEGELLDAGCGTGENTLLADSHRARALGIDISVTAIARARAKAALRGAGARFEAGNIFDFELPVDGFDTVIDSGLFHVFDDESRGRYVSTIARSIRPGGHLYLMCFSDAQPGDWGPRRVSRDELEVAFADQWEIERIDASAFAINPMMGTTSAAAWLVAARRREAG